MTALPMRSPGERGYAAYWRQEFGAAAPGIKALRKQLNGTLSGRAIIGVMNVYGSTMNNTSGRSQLGQEALANRSGYGRETVKRVQAWASDNDWLEVVAPAIPGKVGKTVELHVGTVPGATELHVDADKTTCGSVEPACSSVEETCSSVSEPQTLTLNSQLNSQSSQSKERRAIANAPCFEHGRPGCRCFALASEVEDVEVKTCGCRIEQTCRDCATTPGFASRLPEARQRELYERWNESEGVDRHGQPVVASNGISRYIGRCRA